MSGQRSKRTETEDVSRVDSLLGLLRDVSQRNPSPALREQLGALAARRLSGNPANAKFLRAADRTRPEWLKPALAAALLITAGLVVVFAGLFRHHEATPIEKTATVSNPVLSPEKKAAVAPQRQPPPARHPMARRPEHAMAQPASPRQMIMRLPYSNGAIETGTGTTIRVSMSQSELLSLGFPINEIVQDRRIIAELTLGDDGLPRAISLPMPLEVMKEEKK
jgi:hypothetical protein